METKKMKRGQVDQDKAIIVKYVDNQEIVSGLAKTLREMVNKINCTAITF